MGIPGNLIDRLRVRESNVLQRLCGILAEYHSCGRKVPTTDPRAGVWKLLERFRTLSCVASFLVLEQIPDGLLLSLFLAPHPPMSTVPTHRQTETADVTQTLWLKSPALAYALAIQYPFDAARQMRRWSIGPVQRPDYANFAADRLAFSQSNGPLQLA